MPEQISHSLEWLTIENVQEADGDDRYKADDENLTLPVRIIKAGHGNAVQRYYYPAATLEAAANAGIYRDRDVYRNHVTPSQLAQQGGVRRIEDKAGYITAEVWWNPRAQAVEARMTLFDDAEYKRLKRGGKRFGMSHDATVAYEAATVDGRAVNLVRQVRDVNSVDIVSAAGAGGGVGAAFEAALKEMAMDTSNNQPTNPAAAGPAAEAGSTGDMDMGAVQGTLSGHGSDLKKMSETLAAHDKRLKAIEAKLAANDAEEAKEVKEVKESASAATEANQKPAPTNPELSAALARATEAEQAALIANTQLATAKLAADLNKGQNALPQQAISRAVESIAGVAETDTARLTELVKAALQRERDYLKAIGSTAPSGPQISGMGMANEASVFPQPTAPTAHDQLMQVIGLADK